MTLTLLTAPAEPLISTSDAKAWLRVTSSAEDALIASLVAAAQGYLDGRDGILGRALVTQTWAYTLPAFPSGSLVLPLPRVQSITSVEYFDADGVEQTLSSAVYRLVANDDDALLEVVDGETWPSAMARNDAVTITFVTGYGAASAVPAPITTAAKLLLANWFEARAATTDKPMSELPMGVRALLMPYRVPRGLI